MQAVAVLYLRASVVKLVIPGSALFCGSYLTCPAAGSFTIACAMAQHSRAPATPALGKWVLGKGADRANHRVLSLPAQVGAALSQGHSTTLGFSTGLFERFQNPKDKRDFVTAGEEHVASACRLSACLRNYVPGPMHWEQVALYPQSAEEVPADGVPDY